MNRDRLLAGQTVFILVLFCFVILLASFVHAQDRKRSPSNVVLAIGTSKVVEGNLALAKERAISNALRKGLENYLVRRLESQGVVNNFEKIVKKIIPRAEEEIENFHILTEIQINDTFNILVRLKINEKVFDRKLKDSGFVLDKGPVSKVLFLVYESVDGDISFWWKNPEFFTALNATELALYNAFKGRGFSLINRTLNLPETENLEQLRSFPLRDEDILEWGGLFSADVVVYGGTEFVSQEGASLKLRAFDVSQRVQIVQGMHVEDLMEGPGGKSGKIDTVKNLANRLADRLIPTIIQFRSSLHERIRQFVITLEGVTTYGQFRLFRDFLKTEVEGIDFVRQNRVRKNSISAIVGFQGDRDSILAHIMNHEGLPFSLDLLQVDKENIRLKIK
ncbi:MAG: hypothetical protein V2J25_12380 [Desulfatiglans sp.]|jgi:hypothetical protein|nr:hypothetical protein [Thermodesulfobacteriota bacterium]MEE4353658.1 hypothetical protein [Desulfatiglans sp.]